LQDNFTAEIDSCTFKDIAGQTGGILTSNKLSSSWGVATIVFNKCTVENAIVTDYGGVFYLNHGKLNMSVSHSTITDNYAPIGGVFYISAVLILTLQTNEFTYNTGNIGMMMYSFASSATIYMN
jgi:hypothetical protein